MRVIPTSFRPAAIVCGGTSRWGPFRAAFVVIAVELSLIGGTLLAVLALWPSARIELDRTALARIHTFQYGEQVERVQVLGPTGGQIRFALRDGRIVPLGKLTEGTRLKVKLTVRRSGWIGWLVGRTEHVHAFVRTPMTKLAARIVYPAAGKPIRIAFSRPVSVISLRFPPEAAKRITLAHPRRNVPIGLVARDSTTAGSVIVAGTARTWERLPAPVRVNWFPAGPAPVALVRPSPKTTLVPSQPIVLTFSRPIESVLGTTRPRIAPKTPGAWHEPNDHTLVFQPSGIGFPLGVQVRLMLPRAIKVIAGDDPSEFRTITWPVPPGSPERLKQLLAQLGYLPVTWEPARDTLAVTGAAAEARAAVQPPEGIFKWRFASTPTALKRLWFSTQRSVVMRGALMAFESSHGLTADGLPDRVVWKALLNDALTGRRAGGGYSYVFVSESIPQTLTLWHNGQVVLKSAVNTGIPSRPTALGTYPVYLHLTETTMSGTNPDGTPYHDPGVPWVNYFNGGDAVHGFVRPGYGYPQSLGCVEAPISTAGQIFPYVNIGTLVTIVA